jgi:hypothetical protein
MIKQMLRSLGRGARYTAVGFGSLILGGSVLALGANYLLTQGSGTTFGSVVVGGVNYAQHLLCDLTTPAQCAAVSAGGAVKVDASASTQPVSAASLPLPTGAATSALQTTGNTSLTTINTTLGSPMQATGGTVAVTQATSSSLKAQVDPLTIGTWGLQISTQNSATPTNGHLVEGQFNTSPTTITAGNVSPLQLDNAGNLLVNIKAGAGSGGTAIADNSVFTTGTTNETPIGCYNGSPTTTTGHVGIVACTTAGSVHTTVDNTNANGQAVMASSSPVVIASNQSTIPVNGSGTAGTANSGVVTVQGIASMTPLTVTQTASADPCFASAKTNLAINQNGTSSVQLIALSGSTKIYVCSLFLLAAGATTVAITTGTGSACVTGNAAVIGTTTSGIANSVALAANGGWTLGSGVGSVAIGAASSELCMILGTSVFVSGNLTYVQQ